MTHISTEQYPDVAMEEVTHDHDDATTDRLEQIREARKRSVPAPPYSALTIIGVRPAPMAVTDENGYLIPVCTAYDLLRACEYFWRASQD